MLVQSYLAILIRIVRVFLDWKAEFLFVLFNATTCGPDQLYVDTYYSYIRVNLSSSWGHGGHDAERPNHMSLWRVSHMSICTCLFAHFNTGHVPPVSYLAAVWGKKKDKNEKEKKSDERSSGQRSHFVTSSHLHLCNYVAVTYMLSALCSSQHCQELMCHLAPW